MTRNGRLPAGFRYVFEEKANRYEFRNFTIVPDEDTILAFMYRRQGISFKELCEVYKVSPSSMKRRLANLRTWLHEMNELAQSKPVVTHDRHWPYYRQRKRA